jgi:hypothetical protein
MKKILSILMIFVLCFTLVPEGVTAKTKEVSIKNCKQHSLGDITFAIPKGWIHSKVDDDDYYVCDVNNMLVVNKVALDTSDIGYENDDFKDLMLQEIKKVKDFHITSTYTQKMKNDITALVVNAKSKVDKEGYYIKIYSFVYKGNVYTFMFFSTTKANLNTMSKLFSKVSLKHKAEPSVTPPAETPAPTPSATPSTEPSPTPTVTPSVSPSPASVTP